ncbi:hypothetical protein D3H65_20685 [Paraflavitalea soli]|uniref:Agrobacterium tumefaciens protein Atu4866 n=1 Tax=Paraflavitalea soli TaxID=2315862 RepID=A0A3B7MT82_9BACT|nr:Atu4866 domain-containing protein [Paraflavitalea soli]AXY76260.1 hypothetical protein D3H65_20685 [Paraflavitalea soli]
MNETPFYVGVWITRNGYIRHELLPDGHYVEARGDQKNAFHGKYTFTGDHIDYVDDDGLTTDAVIKDGTLYHAGVALHKVEQKIVAFL